MMYIDLMTCIFLEMYDFYPLRLLRNLIYACRLNFDVKT